MGVNIDIDVYTRKIIDFSSINEFINKEGLSITIKQVESIKDWEYNNLKKLSIEIDDNIIAEELNKKNIILIYAIANNTANCGVQIEYNKYGFYEYGFYLDRNSIGIDTKKSLALYNKITKAINELIFTNDLIVCGIGEETLVVSYDNVNMIIEKSSTLERWILPNKVKINNYIESKYGELHIYDKKDLWVAD